MAITPRPSRESHSRRPADRGVDQEEILHLDNWVSLHVSMLEHERQIGFPDKREGAIPR